MSHRPAFPQVSLLVDEAAISRYAELSGDYNPLHVDAAFAAAGPFGAVVAHGPIALQTVFAALEAWLGIDGVPQGATIDVTFRGPVRAGSTVVCRAVQIVEYAARVVVLVRCTAGDDEVLQALINLPRGLAPSGGSGSSESDSGGAGRQSL